MGKQLLVENFVAKPSDIRRIPFNEDTSAVLYEGKEYSCVGAYTFPVSRPGEVNLNDRIYEGILWEGVIKRQEGENAFGLCDHPNGGGSVKDGFCVWHNLRFNENKSLVLCDAYLFGMWGRQAKEAIDAGGALGMSSVGFGEFKEDGRTIDPNTYELRRPADWVLDPSYQVFGTKSDEIQSESPTKKENVKPSSEEIESKEVENIKEKSMAEKKTKLEENIFRVQIEGMLKDVKSSTDLDYCISESKKALSFMSEAEFSDTSLENEFNAVLAENQKKVNELVKKGERLDATEGEKKEAEEKVSALTEEVTKLKEEKEEAVKSLEEATTLADSLKIVVEETQVKLEEAETALQTSFTAEEVLKMKEDHKEELKRIDENSFTTEEVETIQESLIELQKENEELKVEAAKKKEFDNSDKDKEDNKKKDDDKKEESVNPQVLSYYHKMREAHSGMVKIKEEVLGCKTLVEAQKKFIKLKDVVFEASKKSSYMLPNREEEEKSTITERHLPKIDNKLKIRQGWN